MFRRYLTLAALLLCLPAYADNYSGGGGGGGGSVTLNTTCPTSTQSGTTLTINGTVPINAKTGSYGPAATDCGQAFIFTLTGAATYSLPAPSAGFYIPAITNVPSSTNSLTLSPASGQICSTSCAATYVVAAGAPTVSLISDGTNYYVQSSPAALTVSGPGYVVGNYYTQTDVSSIGTGTTAFVVTTTYCAPQWIYNILPAGGGTGTIGTVAFNVTTLGGNAQVAIYRNSVTNTPGTLVANTASINVSTTGIKSGAITASVSPGQYWICFQSDNTALRTQVSTSTIVNPHRVGSLSQAALYTNVVTQLSTTGTFGTWPDLTAASWTQIGAIAPLIEFSFSSIP